MNLVLIAVAALLASLLTFFSGFGLGTLLSPILVLFFPVHLAIAATAIVHLLNNLFKLALMYQYIAWKVFIRFSIPAFFAAGLGAYCLIFLGKLEPISSYQLFSHTFYISPLNLIIGIIFIVFSFSELSKKLKSLSIPSKYLSIGGLISGFFGGLSGNQGAFRSAFLLKADLDKKAFIATGVISACIVDMVRLTIYFLFITQAAEPFSQTLQLTILVASLSAFIGAYLGKQYLEKITMNTVQQCVSYFMLIVGFLLSLGLI